MLYRRATRHENTCEHAEIELVLRRCVPRVSCTVARRAAVMTSAPHERSTYDRAEPEDAGVALACSHKTLQPGDFQVEPGGGTNCEWGPIGQSRHSESTASSGMRRCIYVLGGRVMLRTNQKPQGPHTLPGRIRGPLRSAHQSLARLSPGPNGRVRLPACTEFYPSQTSSLQTCASKSSWIAAPGMVTCSSGAHSTTAPTIMPYTSAIRATVCRHTPTA